MSPVRTIEKDKYEVGENRTHDTKHCPLPRDSEKLEVGYFWKKPTKFVFEFVN